MKILHQIGHQQLAVREARIPDPGPGEVLIKTAVSALCGSEMSTFRQAGRPTGNLGHEAAGTVARLGAGVRRLRENQRVGVSAIAGCGACEYCRRGQYTWCEQFRFFCDMHAEYFVIPELACHPLPEDISWEVGVLITGDGIGVPYHTSTKISGPGIASVAVFGVGPVGLGNVLMQSHLGRKVIAIDRSETRLTLARRLGAVDAIAAGDGTDVLPLLKACTGGAGVDVAIEAAGMAATARLCFAAVKKGGTVVFNGEQSAIELSPSEDFIRRDISAVGSWFYHFHEYAGMLEMARNGFAVDSLITHRFPLEGAGEAYGLMQAGDSGKILFTY